LSNDERGLLEVLIRAGVFSKFRRETFDVGEPECESESCVNHGPMVGRGEGCDPWKIDEREIESPGGQTRRRRGYRSVTAIPPIFRITSRRS
jgi:hypothetical protein